MTATLPETIEHLDFAHAPGCQTKVKDVRCAATPVTHRIVPPCDHAVLLCAPHAKVWAEVTTDLWMSMAVAVTCNTCGRRVRAFMACVVPL